jgi:hypothetical protein
MNNKVMNIQDMDDLNIIFNNRSFRQLDNGNTVSCDIYWQFKNIYFPEENWNDLISVILSWWTNSLISLLSRSSKLERFCYMDGPCWLDISVMENDLLVECYHEVIDRSPIIICRVKPYIMTKKLLLVSSRFLSECKLVIRKFPEQLLKDIECIKNNCAMLKSLLNDKSHPIFLND